MSKHSRPRKASCVSSRQTNQGEGNQMLSVSLYDLTDMTRSLEGLLGAERVAALSADEIVYLAGLALEDLPEVPDELARLLARSDQRQFTQAQALLAIRQTRRARCAPARGRGMRQVRQRTPQPLADHSPFDDDITSLRARLEALAGW